MSRGVQSELDATLAAVVEDMRLATNELAATLETEREALIGADAAALDQIGARKHALMQQLEQYDAERLQLIQATPAAAALLEADWKQVLQSLETCRQLNLRNGTLVGQRLAQVRRALAVLTGQPGESGIYGPSGELRARLRSQQLARA